MLKLHASALAKVQAFRKEMENSKEVLSSAAVSTGVRALRDHIADIAAIGNLQVHLGDMEKMKTVCAKLTQELEVAVTHLSKAQMQSRELTQTLEDMQQTCVPSMEAGTTILPEFRHGSNDDGDLATHALSLFECCSCRSSKHDPVQLDCLHYYCQSCLASNDNRTQGLQFSVVTCPACYVVTKRSTVLRNGFLYTHKRTSALWAAIVWCNKCDTTVQEKKAEVWCVDCAEALCAVCNLWHNKFKRNHCILELEEARTLRLSKLTQTAPCSLHNLMMETHCFTCCSPKCIECLAICTAGAHDRHLLSDEKSRQHISITENRVSDAMKLLGSLLPGLMQKCRALAGRLSAARTSGKRMLVDHRRRLHSSTLSAFDESDAEVSQSLKTTEHESPVIVSRDVTRSCPANIEALALTGLQSLQLLGVRYFLKSVASCSSGRGSIRKLLQSVKERGWMNIYGSLSLTSDIMLSAFLGETNRRRAGLRAPLLFQQASVSFDTPVDCCDLAVTRDGHVLLAAREHGLLMYSDRGQQLSSWRPERRSDGEDEAVYCVAALSSGGAAVGLYHARVVVLLKLSQTGDAWLLDRRVAVLQSHPWRLAVHGDLLAAAETRLDEQQQRQFPWVVAEAFYLKNELKLLRLSSGQLHYTLIRDYNIESVALTALCVVTTSLSPVRRNSGAKGPYVLDAFSHAGEFMWRYETSDEEVMTGLCVSADAWSRVYVAVYVATVYVPRRLMNEVSRVLSIGGADGRDIREVLRSRTHGLQLLSLARGQQRTLLAVIGRSHDRTVSLYEATSLGDEACDPETYISQ